MEGNNMTIRTTLGQQRSFCSASGDCLWGASLRRVGTRGRQRESATGVGPVPSPGDTSTDNIRMHRFLGPRRGKDTTESARSCHILKERRDAFCPPLDRHRNHGSALVHPIAARSIVASALLALWLAASTFAGDPDPAPAIVPPPTEAYESAATSPTAVEVNAIALDGQLDAEKARLVIEADLRGLSSGREKCIPSAAIQQTIAVSRAKLTHTISIQIDAVQGELKEVELGLSGVGEITRVASDALEHWSVRRGPDGARSLVVRVKRADKPVKSLVVQAVAETSLGDLPQTVTPLALIGDPASLSHGYVRIDTPPELAIQVGNPAGVAPIESKFLPESLRPVVTPGAPETIAFRFHGTPYSLPLTIEAADPESSRVVVSQFRLQGRLSGDSAEFTLSGLARVKNPKGGSLTLLAGRAALTEVNAAPYWHWRLEGNKYVAVFDRDGEFALRLKFNAAVRQTNGWNELDFVVAPVGLAPVTIEGLKADTEFRFADGARPERAGEEFVSFLPPTGQVQLAWKEARPETEGALFYAAEALSQIAISPGLMRQTALLDFKVMQGELNRVTLRLRGAGEVTRVQGPTVLSWVVEPLPNSADRRLAVQLNEAQKDQFSFQVQLQTPLGAFPQAVEAMQVLPEGTTRFGGCYRIVNEGAVRLEVLQASGLSQISPEQFPQTDATQTLALTEQTTQVFAYRFSGGAFELRMQADNILPELAVSALIEYHLGETELAIDAEFEVDVREAPLREMLLRIPKGYAVARLNAPGLGDYFPTESADLPEAQLRLVYGAPVSGRQVVQLRLERNQPLAESAWRLPRIDVLKAKSVRGHVGVTADPGFRLTPGATQGLTEIAGAFFPKKLAGIQAAFRMSDAAWQATLAVERLPQSIQADTFHLFSIGEGVAYGSSIINYVVSGAPIAVFKIELSAEYFNVEFSGKDVRSWQKADGGYQVQLHTPVAGAYTLLATYERPFKPQGDTLTFTGARPLDAQSEQGHTIVVSAYQFQVKPVNLSNALLPLETGEVPAEYRLFFDAPILAAYRYAARPFNLQLELKPLAQSETISQVVDRTSFVTRISDEGEVVTDARYFVKNKGAPHLRLVIPEGTQLWSVTVDNAPVVPVTSDRAHLIPLPQHADADAVNDLQIKLAARAKDRKRIAVAAPIVSAPVLLAEWHLVPDTGRRLVCRRGPLTPVGATESVTGFAGLQRLLSSEARDDLLLGLGLALGLTIIAAWLWRLASDQGVHKLTLRHLLGGILALAAAALAAIALAHLVDLARSARVEVPRDLRFVAPVQQADSALALDIANVPVGPSWFASAWALAPALPGVLLWLYGLASSKAWLRVLARVLGWVLILWAALRWPNGAPLFFGVLLAFVVLHVFVPWLWRWWRAPRKPAPDTGSAAAAAALLMFGAWLLEPAATLAQADQATGPVPNKTPPLAESVVQEVRVEGQYAIGSARVRWQARQGDVLPLLHAPGVLTRIEYPTNSARLVQTAAADWRDTALLAEQTGLCEIRLDYQVQTVTRESERAFALPTAHGLVNRLTLTLVGLDVEINAPQAVSVQPVASGASTNTVARLVLAPARAPWIAWKPRSRDTRLEKAVFYAELSQLFVPGAGVVEALHQVQLRPAQGELSELEFDVPAGATITDVVAPGLSLWRFDPQSRQLRVRLTPAQSKPFNLLVKSQIATGPLPFEQTAGLLGVRGAAGQLGLLGVATGNEVQLDDVRAESFSPINLEDFPAAMLDPLRLAIAGLTLRRAFRYSDAAANLTLEASAVQPDVRVEAEQTLSLGEDRTVLAANLEVEVMRAGIFKLSFLLPTGLDVESISGPALSHWTELKTDAGRVITLHLKSKTEGKQTFAVSLSGPGVRSATGWAVPRLGVREAGKQRGQLLLVPEQGLRLQIASREGVTQLDPLKAGVRQKGVLAFRLLQSDWSLTLDLERMDAWTQVASLQHVVIGDAQLKVAVNLQYEIENTGIKTLGVRLPADAEGVRFRGEQLTDFRPLEGQAGAGTRDWEIKLNRRVIGKYLLQVTYNLPLGDRLAETDIVGVEALDANMQRGFLTVQAGGRLQVRVDSPPEALQPAEWQSIPRALQQDVAATAANYTFRLVEPAYRLPVQIERHAAAKLLPARVDSLTLSSVVSDDGIVLTQARIQLTPGDKRLLHLTLPDKARFWFAFVNQSSVWPWRETNQVLIPLEQHAKTGQPTLVEFFYAARAGAGSSRALNLELLGPRFDLPLENISWRVFLGEQWRLSSWRGSLQLQPEQGPTDGVAVDLETYIRNEAALQQAKTKEAEQFLNWANRLLVEGDPEQARRAFTTAYGLSQHDNAFNEDARVQLHNLKMQQALVGLNVRQAKVAGEPSVLAATPRALRESQAANYTQQEAKQLIERNTAEDNAVQMRLAERLIRQQDAAAASPAAIRVTIPEQGRLLTFSRPLQVQPWADLTLNINARPAQSTTLLFRLTILVCVVLLIGFFAWLGRTKTPPRASE